MSNFNVRALGVLMNDDGEVLLLQRAPQPASQGHIGWEFCGGGIEPEESPEAAIAREYKKKTGLDVEAMQIFNARTGTRAGAPFMVVAYLCRLLGGKVKLSPKHDDFKWVPIEDLGDYDLGPLINLDRDAFLAISTGSGMIDSE